MPQSKTDSDLQRDRDRARERVLRQGPQVHQAKQPRVVLPPRRPADVAEEVSSTDLPVPAVATVEDAAAPFSKASAGRLEHAAAPSAEASAAPLALPRSLSWIVNSDYADVVPDDNLVASSSATGNKKQKLATAPASSSASSMPRRLDPVAACLELRDDDHQRMSVIYKDKTRCWLVGGQFDYMSLKGKVRAIVCCYSNGRQLQKEAAWWGIGFHHIHAGWLSSSPPENVAEQLKQLMAFLSIHSGPVLFHCGRGLSASCSIACLALMVVKNVTAGKAVDQICDLRKPDVTCQLKMVHIFELLFVASQHRLELQSILLGGQSAQTKG